ncbi:hypothetical protein AA313_de0207610 [Arthrobotrys entomopaga]|nr:hypothetical protein AA313_de0207610 [Arthrobotrys entomopaga]
MSEGVRHCIKWFRGMEEHIGFATVRDVFIPRYFGRPFDADEDWIHCTPSTSFSSAFFTVDKDCGSNTKPTSFKIIYYKARQRDGDVVFREVKLNLDDLVALLRWGGQLEDFKKLEALEKSKAAASETATSETAKDETTEVETAASSKTAFPPERLNYRDD